MDFILGQRTLRLVGGATKLQFIALQVLLDESGTEVNVELYEW